MEGVISVKYSQFQDFITVIAPISVWEREFETVFFTVAQKKSESADKINKNVLLAIRTLQYKLPKTIRGHVSTVLNTVQAPVFKKTKKQISDAKKIDPALLSKINENMKNINDNNGMKNGENNENENQN